MPTPIGHAVAGLTVAWLTRAAVPGARLNRPADGSHWQAGRRLRTFAGLATVCVLCAVAPDLDILFGSHRAASHSIAGAAIAGLAAGLVAYRLRAPAWRTGAACAAAWGSHVLLDWLGKDSSPPRGIMAFWPVGRVYVESGLDLFAEVSRRYWIPEQFIFGNLQSVARELAILGPIAFIAWMIARRR